MYSISDAFISMSFDALAQAVPTTEGTLRCYFSVFADVSYDFFFNPVKLSPIFMGKVLKRPRFPAESADTVLAPLPVHREQLCRDSAHFWVFSLNSIKNFKFQQPV